MKLIDKSALVAEIERRINSTGDTNQWLCGKLETYKEIHDFIDTLEVKEVQEESVNDDLEEAAKNHAAERYRVTRDRELAEKCKWSFKAGAKWQKEHLGKPADGDDLKDKT